MKSNQPDPFVSLDILLKKAIDRLEQSNQSLAETHQSLDGVFDDPYVEHVYKEDAELIEQLKAAHYSLILPQPHKDVLGVLRDRAKQLTSKAPVPFCGEFSKFAQEIDALMTSEVVFDFSKSGA